MNRILLLIFLLPLTILAQERTEVKDRSAFEATFEKKTAVKQNITADFTQEKVLAYLQAPLVSKGKFYSFEHRLIRWEQYDPTDYVMLMNDKGVFVREKGEIKNNGLKENRMMAGIKDLISETMSGEIIKSKDYSTRYFESDTEYIIELTPLDKQLKKVFSSIELVFNKKTFFLNQMIMYTDAQNYTRIIFSNQKSPDKMEMSVFEEGNL